MKPLPLHDFSLRNLRNWLYHSWKYLVLSLLAFMVMVVAWWRIGLDYQHSLLGQKKSLFQMRAHEIGNSLTSTINQKQAILNGLAAFVKTHPVSDLREHYFEIYAAGLQLNEPVIRAIQYLPDEGLLMVYPLAGNEAIANRSLDLLRNDERANVREDVQRAIDSRRITLSDPYELRQGGKGVISRLAVYDEEQFLGLVAVVLNLEPLLQVPGLYPAPTDIRFAIQDSRRQVFFGDESVLASEPVFAPIELPEGNWMIAVAPVYSWSTEIRAQMITFWLVGLLLAVVVAGATYAIVLRQSSLTETVQIQSEELVERSDKLLLAIEASGIGFFDWDLHTNQAHYSPEWKRQIGYEVGEIGDDVQEWQSRLHPDDRETTLAQVNASVQSGATRYEAEFRLKHKDGSYRWILARGLLQHHANGQPARILGCHIDITKQKQNAMELLASEHRFRGLAESSQDYIMLYDRECRHVYENPAGLRVSGMSEADIIGKTHREAGFSEELSEMWEADIRRVFATGTTSQRLFEWEGVNGTVFLDWRLSPIFDENGQVELALGVSRDITSIKQTEKLLQQ